MAEAKDSVLLDTTKDTQVEVEADAGIDTISEEIREQKRVERQLKCIKYLFYAMHAIFCFGILLYGAYYCSYHRN